MTLSTSETGPENLFMICEPKAVAGDMSQWTGRRTAVDFAHQMRWLVDEAYPDAEVVRLVMDNLNTHQPGSLYEAFEPCEARRIAQRLEFSLHSYAWQLAEHG